MKNLVLTLSSLLLSCSDLSSIDNPAYRGLVPGVCSGTPIACSQRLDGRCGGCTRGQRECHGPIVPHCHGLPGAACDADPECTFELGVFFPQCVTKQCHALPESTCNATAGCGYSTVCSGPDTGFAPCEDAEVEADCVAVSGCTWTEKGGDGG